MLTFLFFFFVNFFPQMDSFNRGFYRGIESRRKSYDDHSNQVIKILIAVTV